MSIQEKLNKVQSELNAPKNLYNKFAGYAYRNCEGILTGLKPLLEKYKATVVLSDHIEVIGNRYYVVATATLTDTETGESVSNVAYAREEDSRKGLTEAQITGSCSSYARKYALNGLLAIDDVQDDDSRDNTAKEQQNTKPKAVSQGSVAKGYDDFLDSSQIMDLRSQMYGR